MTGEASLVLAILAPIAAAVAALLATGRALVLVNWAGIAGTLFAAAALVATVIERGTVRYQLGGWGAPLGIDLYADGVAAALVLLTAIVAGASSVYARAWPGPLEPAGRLGRPLFWPLWHLIWASLNALFLSADIFNLYVTLELVTLAAVILVAQTEERGVLVAAMRYLLAALFGSLLYLWGVALLYGAAGALDMGLLAETLEPGWAAHLAAVLMSVGLLVKTALFPFHLWLPPAHSGAVAPVSAILSGLVVKAGFYLTVRLWLGPFSGLADETFLALVGALGAAAIVWGAVMALREEQIKRIIAYSTVSQLGYLFLIFPLITAAPLAAWNGAFYHVLAHGTAKAAAFLAAGNVLYGLKAATIRSIADLGLPLRMSLLAFALASVSLIGLPPSGGFVSKWLLLQAAIQGGRWLWAVVLILGSLLAAVYLFRILGAAMARPEREIPYRPVPRAMELSALFLALVSMALGVAAAWPIDLLSVGAPVLGIDQPLERIQAEGFWLPVAILLSSFVPGVAIFFLREEQAWLRTLLNLTGALLKVALALVLLAGIYLGFTYEARLAFLPGLDLALRADPLTLQFLILSAGLWLFTTVYAIGYLEGSPDRSRFFGFFSLSVTATTGIALSGNLLTLFFFYEFLTLATYPLVVHRGTPEALRAGRIYLLYTLAGGAAVLAGVASLHALGANLEFRAENNLAELSLVQPTAVGLIFALLIGGFGVKAALVPLHSWLPVAMVAPAPVSALLHAVAVVKAGIFAIIRVLYDIYGIGFSHALGGTAVLAVLAGVTIVYGSVRALQQDEIKRRLAFSTVSQLSYIALGAALASPIALIGALVHLVHQGIMKITLFFCAGNLAETYDIKKVSEVDGMGRLMPITMAAFTVAALGMIGLPPLAGFVSKWYLAGGGIDAGIWWVVPVLAASSALNAAYFLPIVYRAWFRPLRDERPKLRDAGWWLLGPPIVTAALSLGAGILAGFAFSPLGWAEIIATRTYYGVAPEP